MSNINYVFSVCPAGFSAIGGYVFGNGLRGRKHVSLETCAYDCRARRDCISFKQSSSSCWLYNKDRLQPDTASVDGYQLCKKIITGTSLYEAHV